MSRRNAIRLAAAAAPISWGTTYFVTTEFLPPGRPLLAAAARALPIGLLMVMVLREMPRGPWRWRLPVLGALNIGFFFMFLFIAAYRLPGGIASAVIATQPLIVAFLARWVLGDRLAVRVVLAAIAGAGGVALLVLQGEVGYDPVGALAGVAAAVCLSIGIVLQKRWGSPPRMLVFTAWQLLSGGLVLLPFALLIEGLPPAVGGEAVAGIAWLAIFGAALSYPLWFRGVEALSAAEISLLGLLTPIVATALGWVALEQELAIQQMVGAGLVFAAVIAGQAAAQPRRPELAGSPSA